MTPRINDKALHRLNVPELSAGVNYRDGISQVLDNQLTDCKNVWFKNGLLQTRPGVRCADAVEQEIFEKDFIPSTENRKRRIYAKKENFRVIDGKTYFLVVIQHTDKLVFRYYSEQGEFFTISEISDIPKNVDFTCNIFQHDADIYCFCSGYHEGSTTPYYIFKISEDTEQAGDWWQRLRTVRITDDLSEEDGGFYVPLVIYNAGPVDGNSNVETVNGISVDTMTSRGAVMIEGYNLLGKRYKAVYSTAAETDNAAGSSRNYMVYPLINRVHTGSTQTETVNYIGETVVAVITDKEGNEYIHKVKITSSERTRELETDDDLPGDGLRMFVSESIFGFYPKDSTDKAMLWTTDDYVRNNMVVTAPCPNSKENYEKVLNMTCSEWFGGGSEGIYDGIHLFMGGNTKDSEKALVCWSDFDKPLYFSENGYAYVGDKAQRVTAFGKQGESLIILKERETYATQYSSSDSVIDADAVINRSVVDVTATEVTFPMVQVHGFIGCDCPSTVQLCRNRLVWAHSDGKVYTLVSANQWNERSIFEVSAMVQSKLCKHTPEEMKGALSADWEGHYILSLGDKFYLMDYNSYGYASITSYTKNDDAQIHIPWWIWEKPKYNMNTYYDAYPATDSEVKTREEHIDVLSMVTVGGRLYLTAMFKASLATGGDAYYPEVIFFEGEDDELPDVVITEHNLAQTKDRGISIKEIPAMAQTKLFDFGAPTIQKAVPKSEISFGNNEGIPITVTTITDKGETVCEVVLDFEETDNRSPRFFKNVVIRNGERLNNRIGYRLESNGNLFVDAMSLYYKQLGGSK